MKRKKVIVSGVLCVSISIASVLCGCSAQTENKTGDAFIINNGGEYYINGLVAKMESDGSAKSVGYPKEESDYIYANDNAPVILKNGKYVFWNNTIYGEKGDDKAELYKYAFTSDPLVIEKELWVDNDTLSSSSVFENHEYHGCMAQWKTDGDYVYFITEPQKDYVNVDKPIYYKLGRISFDGKTIESVNSITASSYTIDNGWIYYFDNGYVGNENDFSIESENVGLYKIKIDGSQKQKLQGNMEQPSGYEYQYNDLYKNICCYGDYLYFIDYSESTGGKVCRIKTDGTNYEVLSQNNAYSITVDVKNNKLYYAQQNDYYRKLYEVSLDSKQEVELYDDKLYSVNIGRTPIEYYNGYLYLSCYDYNGISPNMDYEKYNCERYDINNNVMEVMRISYKDVEIDNGGISAATRKEGPYLKWDKAEKR